MVTTPVFLPGKSHGKKSLAGYSTWVCRVGHHGACRHMEGSTGHDSMKHMDILILPPPLREIATSLLKSLSQAASMDSP